jgi:hypothetical protein
MSLPSNVGVVSAVAWQRTSWASHEQSTAVRCGACSLAMRCCRSSPVLCFFVSWDLREPVPLTFFPHDSRQCLQVASTTGELVRWTIRLEWQRMESEADGLHPWFSSLVRRAFLGHLFSFQDSFLEPCIGLQTRS